MISEKLKEKIEYLNQLYFSLDEPIPFLKDLSLYPVKVRDYYKFYNSISCFTMDKNQSPEGISLSNLSFLIKKMEEEKDGANFTAQVISLLELVFKVENGLYCNDEKCNQEKGKFFISYNNIRDQLEELEDEKSKQKYFNKIQICPYCGKVLREVYSIKNGKSQKSLCIYDNEISSKKFDELRAIVCYQNMPDFNDEYVDPELKKDLDAKAEMERSEGTVKPSLEKQLICITISTPYTVEDLKDISIRKMVLILRNADAKAHYFCYKQAEMSGMVKFKQSPKHWIYADNKNDLSKEIMTLEDVHEKFKLVT